MTDTEKKPLISIIIPFYNVETFLPRCLDSIKTQTIKKLQFVLVDDGSTDKSGIIADQYAQEDTRFQVYHTKKHGVAAARNYGLSKADSDWIMFVDSDDWVSSDFCNIPFTAAMKYNADLIIFNYYLVTMNNKIKEIRKIEDTNVIDFLTAIDFDDSYLWNKLFHRNIFEGIKFPEGMNFEDIFTTPKLIYNSKRIVCIPDYLYYYRERKNSITHVFTKKQYANMFMSRLEQYNYLMKRGYPKEIGEKKLVSVSIEYLSHVWPDQNDELYQKAVSIINNMNISPELLDFKHRTKLTIWKINSNLFHILYFLKGKKIK